MKLTPEEFCTSTQYKITPRLKLLTSTCLRSMGYVNTLEEGKDPVFLLGSKAPTQVHLIDDLYILHRMQSDFFRTSKVH